MEEAALTVDRGKMSSKPFVFFTLGSENCNLMTKGSLVILRLCMRDPLPASEAQLKLSSLIEPLRIHNPLDVNSINFFFNAN